MKRFVCILAVILSIEALSDKEKWITFKSKYVKHYESPVEEARRFSIFQTNLRRIDAHNAEEEQGLSSFRMGMTQFIDLTSQEFTDMMKLPKQQKPRYSEKVNILSYNDLPDKIDWRDKGAVTEVKDQGSCNSGWSFGVTGTVEGSYFLTYGKLISLSEQNLVDCITASHGCEAGSMPDGLDYIQRNGIMAEKDYVYEGKNGSCRFDASRAAVKMHNYVKLVSGDETYLQLMTYILGPVAVSIHASDNFQLYSSGVLDDVKCKNEEKYLNHGALVVGYGTENGTDYWIVKNSWGSSWGMNGYIWLSRNKNNQCGIATSAVIAEVV